MVSSRSLLCLAASTLTLAQQHVTFVNLDDQDRTMVWATDDSTGYKAPEPVYLSGAGATGTTSMAPFLVGGQWNGRVRAVNGTSTTGDSPKGALAEFSWSDDQYKFAWFDASWNEVADPSNPESLDIDPTGVKMVFPVDQPSTASGCMKWNLTTGCTNAYYYNTDGSDFTRSADYMSDFIVLVGTNGICSGPQVTDWSDFNSLLSNLDTSLIGDSPALAPAGGSPAASAVGGSPTESAVVGSPTTSNVGSFPTAPTDKRRLRRGRRL